MKIHKLALIVLFLLSASAIADEVPGFGHGGPGWWTCWIERPTFYYLGWAHDQSDAIQETLKACAEDGGTCTADEAVCQYGDDA